MTNSNAPNIELSVLRDIGWEYWDPIGLLDEESIAEKTNFDSEYDNYLMQAASMLWCGKPQNAVVEYLVDIEQNYIEMPNRGSDAAILTVAKISDYLKTL